MRPGRSAFKDTAADVQAASDATSNEVLNAVLSWLHERSGQTEFAVVKAAFMADFFEPAIPDNEARKV